MADNTGQPLELVKPSYADAADIAVINANMDVINGAIATDRASISGEATARAAADTRLEGMITGGTVMTDGSNPMTGSLRLNHSTGDVTQSDNGVSSSSVRNIVIRDSGGNNVGWLESSISTSAVETRVGVREYDSSGTSKNFTVKCVSTKAGARSFEVPSGVVLKPQGGIEIVGAVSLGSNVSGQVNGIMVKGGGTRNAWMLKNISASDSGGDAVLLGNDGMTVIGGGESKDSIYSVLTGTTEPDGNHAPGWKRLVLASDYGIHVYTSCKTIGNRVHWLFDGAALKRKVDTMDISASNNSVTSTQSCYVGLGDKNGYNAGFTEYSALANGKCAVQMSSRKLNGSTAVSNYVILRTLPDYTKEVEVSDPQLWRNALGASSGVWPVSMGGTGKATEAKNKVFASPASSTGAPSFRALVDDDLPSSISASRISGTLSTDNLPDRYVSATATHGVNTVFAGPSSGSTMQAGAWRKLVAADLPDTYVSATTSQTKNTVFAAPSGSNGSPLFRALVNADLPVVDATHGGTAQTSLRDSANALINGLAPGTASITDDDTAIVTQNTDPTQTTYFRRPVSYLWDYIQSKANGAYPMLTKGTASIPDGANLNNYTTPGTYYATSYNSGDVTNCPASSSFKMVVEYTISAQYGIQTITEYSNGAQYQWKRYWYVSSSTTTWGNWFRSAPASSTAATANRFLATPSTAAGLPSYRSIVMADLPFGDASSSAHGLMTAAQCTKLDKTIVYDSSSTRMRTGDLLTSVILTNTPNLRLETRTSDTGSWSTFGYAAINASAPSDTSQKAANKVLATPNGSSGYPSMRALVPADIPGLAASKITSETFAKERLITKTWTYLYPSSGGSLTSTHARYCKVGHIVYVEIGTYGNGRAMTDEVDYTWGTLPSGYRPPVEFDTCLYNNGGYNSEGIWELGVLFVTTDGVVHTKVRSNTSWCWGTICFPCI